VKLKPGERLIHSQYEDAKESLLRAAVNAGYLNAN
jgi:hypothetical protein